MENRKVGLSNRCCSVCKARLGPMFHFPTNRERRKAWRQLLSLDCATDFGQICAAHFRPEDVKKCKGHYRLVKGSEPFIQTPVSAIPRCVIGTTSGSAIPRCFVPGCGKLACDDTTLHYFPRLYERRCQWANLFNVAKVPSKHSFVCSNHFVPSDFRISGGKRVLKSSATPSENLAVLPDALVETQRSQGNEDGVMGPEQNVGLPNSEIKENCSEEVLSGSLNSSEASSSTPLCSNEERSVDALFDVSSIPPFSHGTGSLNIDERLSLNRVLRVTDNSDIAEISSAFQKLSNRLTEDIAKISNSSSCSRPNDKNQGTCSSMVESCSTQTGTTQINLFDWVHNDTQLKAFTGVTFTTFNCLLKLVLELHGEDDVEIPMKFRILLTLCKLRLNLSYECLSVFVGIEKQKCGSIFASTLHLLAVVLQHTIYWPSKEAISLNMPKCFDKYRNSRVVLDCTEVSICSPDCLKCRIQLYSHYEGCQTVKVLVGVAPSGMITYLSKVYGGRASDKQIFEEIDLLTLLDLHMDAVMVDKGFHIDTVCDELIIHHPPFVEKNQPFTPAKVKQNPNIAHARVHVEHVIQRMKIFKILQSKISWGMVHHVDEIFFVIAGLVNLSPPILSDDRCLSESRSPNLKN